MQTKVISKAFLSILSLVKKKLPLVKKRAISTLAVCSLGIPSYSLNDIIECVWKYMVILMFFYCINLFVTTISFDDFCETCFELPISEPLCV